MDIMNWRKSSYSGSNGAECLETATVPGAVLVRDSKCPEGGPLAFTPAAWERFTASLR